MLKNCRAQSIHAAGAAAATLLILGGLAVLPAHADERVTPGPPPKLPVAASTSTDQFIVRVKDTAGPAAASAGKAAAKAATKLGAVTKGVRQSAAGGHVVKLDKALPPGEAERYVDALRSDPEVEYAEPDTRMRAAAEPNDGMYPLQWNLRENFAGLRAAGAWEVTRGAGAVVAVVDTGITSHPDLDNNVLPGYDMISSAGEARDGNGRDGDPTDEGDWISENQCGSGSQGGASSWHGTHVAGTVAAITNNVGTTGVAPEAKILPVRALGACGGYTSDIADSIVWAAGGVVSGAPVNPTPAAVINLSLGGITPCSATYQNAINFAYNAGAAVVVAAGNASRPAADSSPANCENVITVAASSRTGARAPYSNYGAAVDVAAPGGDTSSNGNNGILSTVNTGSTTRGEAAWTFMQGTSMAAPQVAGVAALLRSEMGSAFRPDLLEERLKATARPLPSGCSGGCGAGLVDAAAALDLSGTGTSPAGYQPPAVSPFTDVTTSQQFYKEMAWLSERGISTGWGEANGSRTYRALQPVNRDAMAAFLYRLAGEPAYNPPSESPFSDVQPSQQFYKEMAWLANEGISTGWVEAGGSRTYRALQPISRDAMAVFLYRLAGKPPYTPPAESPFTDVATGQPFYAEISWLADRRISEGWVEAGGSRTYRPLQPIQRDAMAAFLFRLDGLLN